MEKAMIHGQTFAVREVNGVRVIWFKAMNMIADKHRKELENLYVHNKEIFTSKDTFIISKETADECFIPITGKGRRLRVFTESGFNKLMNKARRPDLIDDAVEYWGINGKKVKLDNEFEDEVITMAEKIIDGRRSMAGMAKTMEAQTQRIAAQDAAISSLMRIIEEMKSYNDNALVIALKAVATARGMA